MGSQPFRRGFGQWIRQQDVAFSAEQFPGHEAEFQTLQQALSPASKIHDVLLALGEFGQRFRREVLMVLTQKCLGFYSKMPRAVRRELRPDPPSEPMESIRQLVLVFRKELTWYIPEPESAALMSEFGPEVRTCKDKEISAEAVLDFMGRLIELDTETSTLSPLLLEIRDRDLAAKKLLEQLFHNTEGAIRTLRTLLNELRMLSPQATTIAARRTSDILCGHIASEHAEELSTERIATLFPEAKGYYNPYDDAPAKAAVRNHLAVLLEVWAGRVLAGEAASQD